MAKQAGSRRTDFSAAAMPARNDPSCGLAQNAAPADLTKLQPVPNDYKPKKTSWGDPDLRGTWPIDSIASLPFQRPKNFGDRFYLTDEEYQQRLQQVEVELDVAGKTRVGQGEGLAGAGEIVGPETLDAEVVELDDLALAALADGLFQHLVGAGQQRRVRRRRGHHLRQQRPGLLSVAAAAQGFGEHQPALRRVGRRRSRRRLPSP